MQSLAAHRRVQNKWTRLATSTERFYFKFYKRRIKGSSRLQPKCVPPLQAWPRHAHVEPASKTALATFSGCAPKFLTHADTELQTSRISLARPCPNGSPDRGRARRFAAGAPSSGETWRSEALRCAVRGRFAEGRRFEPGWNEPGSTASAAITSDHAFQTGGRGGSSPLALLCLLLPSAQPPALDQPRCDVVELVPHALPDALIEQQERVTPQRVLQPRRVDRLVRDPIPLGPVRRGNEWIRRRGERVARPATEGDVVPERVRAVVHDEAREPVLLRLAVVAVRTKVERLGEADLAGVLDGAAGAAEVRRAVDVDREDVGRLPRFLGLVGEKGGRNGRGEGDALERTGSVSPRGLRHARCGSRGRARAQSRSPRWRPRPCRRVSGPSCGGLCGTGSSLPAERGGRTGLRRAPRAGAPRGGRAGRRACRAWRAWRISDRRSRRAGPASCILPGGRRSSNWPACVAKSAST